MVKKFITHQSLPQQDAIEIELVDKQITGLSGKKTI